MKAGLWVAVLLALASVCLRPAVADADAPPQAPAESSTEAASASPATDTLSSDSLAVARKPKSRADSIVVVRHGFNHKQQLITGGVVMTCLAMVMVVMNNYNPR